MMLIVMFHKRNIEKMKKKKTDLEVMLRQRLQKKEKKENLMCKVREKKEKYVLKILRANYTSSQLRGIKCQ